MLCHVYIKYILVSVSCLLLTSCSKQYKSQRSRNGQLYSAPVIKLQKSFIAHVSDIECADCAQSVVDIFLEQPGVSDARYISIQKDCYDTGYILIYAPAETNFNEQLIGAKLKELGFDLISIVQQSSL